jgi:hypothetical protein
MGEPYKIDLSKSELERLKTPTDILQKDAFTRLTRLINTQLSEIPPEQFADYKETALSYPRPHNAVLIEGGRGSGKTTFLLTALQRLDNAKDRDIGSIAQKLYVLPMIDPTLIETKENVIIVILSMIETAIAHARVNVDVLTKSRQALAEGLGLLDGIGANAVYGSEWEDASWVMSRGLNKAMKGRLFERKLGGYIEDALKALDKHAFVLAFDDVDTNFSLGYTILETIRKYLTSPRLVLLVSGDLDLYGRLLRRNIYETFGDKVLKNDPGIIGEDKHDIANAVLELEEQYLLKVLPPQNRVSMLALGGIIQGERDRVKISLHSGDDGEDVKDWASTKIRQQLLEDSSTRHHPFFDFVAMEHLRLVLSYLRALDVEDKQQSRKAVLTVFEARLRTMRVPTDLIDKGNFEYTLRETFSWLIRQEDTSDLLRFGVPADRTKAIVLHCLGLCLAQGLETRHGAVLQALFSLGLPVAMMRRPELADEKNREAVYGFLWAQASPTLPELAARIGSIDRFQQKIGKVRASSFGSVGLANQFQRDSILHRVYGGKSSQAKTVISDLADRPGISEVTKQWLEKIVAADGGKLQPRNGVAWFSVEDLRKSRCGEFGDVLSLIVYGRFSARGETFWSVSAISLFAVIGSLLMSNDISDLAAYSVSSTVPAFGTADSTEDVDSRADEEPPVPETGDAADGESDPADQKAEFDLFLTNLKAWHAFARRHFEAEGISPAMLGSIAVRIHDDLMGLDENVTTVWKSGEILHRQITTILHGMLVFTSPMPGRKESTKDTDRPFIEALGQATAKKNLHSFVVILLSCPLVWAFLNPNEVFKRSGNSTVSLKEAVKEALDAWNASRIDHNSEGSSRDFASWLVPPKIRINFGVNAVAKRFVEVDGFYDVLNVVPRYES